MKELIFTAVIEYDAESRMYVGSVPQLPGAFTQGETLDELRENLKEVVELVLEDMRENGEEIQISEFVGTETLTVAV